MLSPNWIRVAKQAALWASMIVATYAFWRWIAVYLLPFGIAWLVAMLLDPLVSWLIGRGLSRTAAVWIALFAGVAALLAFGALMLSIILGELMRLTGRLPQYVGGWQSALDRVILSAGRLRTTLGLSPSLLNAQLSSAARVVEVVLRQALLTLSIVPAGILVIVVAGVAVFFVLRDGRAMRRQFQERLSDDLRLRVTHLQSDIMAGTLGFLRAQMVLVALTAVTTTVGLMLIGSSYAVVLGLVAGLLDLIPFLGPAALIVPWALVLMAMGDMLGAVKLLAVLIAVALSRQLIEPRLVGRQTGLHPLWVLFAFYVGVQLFGPVGFIVGPISAVVLQAVGRTIIDPPAPVRR